MIIKSTFPRAAVAVATTLLCACVPGLLAGCSRGAPAVSAPCAVIVDGTRSGNTFHAGQRLHDTLPGFLLENGCRQVAFVPLTYSSQDSACTKPVLDISPDLGPEADPAAVQAGRRKFAVRQAMSVLTCAQQDERQAAGGGGSDVLGALARAMTERPPGSGTYHVLVVSDLIQLTSAANLYTADLRTQASRAKLITQLILKGLIPDMRDTALEVTDRGRDLSGGSHSGDVTSVDFNDFWAQLFASKAAGDPQVSYN